MHYRRRGIDGVAQVHNLLPGLHQLAQAVRIDFGRSPVRVQDFQELFFLERAHHTQRIVFVRQLPDLVSDRAFRDVLDVLIFSSGVVALLGALLQRPVETSGKAGSPDQTRGILDERIVVQDPQHLGFDIGDAIEGIEQQSARALIQRQRHGIYGEIAAAQIFLNAGGSDDGRLADLLVVFRAGHADFGADVARQYQKQCPHIVVVAGELRSGTFEILLQFERVALDGKVEVRNGEAADDVADCAAGKVEGHARRAGYALHQIDAFHLIRRQPDFHGVNVISHSSSSDPSSGQGGVFLLILYYWVGG